VAAGCGAAAAGGREPHRRRGASASACAPLRGVSWRKNSLDRATRLRKPQQANVLRWRARWTSAAGSSACRRSTIKFRSGGLPRRIVAWRGTPPVPGCQCRQAAVPSGAGRLVGWQAGRLAGWQAGRLAGRQAGRQEHSCAGRRPGGVACPSCPGCHIPTEGGAAAPREPCIHTQSQSHSLVQPWLTTAFQELTPSQQASLSRRRSPPPYYCAASPTTAPAAAAAACPPAPAGPAPRPAPCS
jgi:hypothetical protein